MNCPASTKSSKENSALPANRLSKACCNSGSSYTKDAINTVEALLTSSTKRARHEESENTSTPKAAGRPKGLGTTTSWAGAGAGAALAWAFAFACGKPGLGAPLPVAVPCRPQRQCVLQRHSRQRLHFELSEHGVPLPSLRHWHSAPVNKLPLQRRPLLVMTTRGPPDKRSLSKSGYNMLRVLLG